MSIIAKIGDWSRRTRTTLTPSDVAWRGATIGVFLLGVLIVAIYFATTIVPSFAVQKLPAFLVWIGVSVLLGLAALLAAILIMSLPVRFRVIAAVMTPILVLWIFPGGETTSIVGGLSLLVIFALLGGALAVVRQDGFRVGDNRMAVAALVAGISGLLGGLIAIFSDVEPVNPLLDDYVLEDRTLDLPNPGLPGDYEVMTLTYGSGTDRQRREFGEDVDVVSRSVDGSRLIDNWDGLSGWLRSSYWGFDVTELPLQARVWMPAGEGPFPLVLVVHGNHSMEDYSDPGYDYLGEHFASRGIILASVDENFINGTFSARVDVLEDRPGLQEENDARGWLLLQHLAQWRDWSAEPGHRFENRVDMDRVALIGHSRGGEAVGIAAAFNALDRYPDDASVDFEFGFNLRGVIAIAPVYGQYEPRERPTPIRDVNYFTIHGDMDGDVQSFEGIGQYSRVGFSGDDYRFRSSLYVVGANHGQFNTTWENLDTGLFRAWALDTGRIMEREAQRDVARVYFTAFLDIVLNDRTEYLPIFRDARYASGWLPETFFINQFSDSTETNVVDFEEDIDPSTMVNGRIETQNVSRWYETGNELKYDELDTHSLVVAWDDRYSDETASVSFSFNSPVAGDVLVASISAIEIDTLPPGWDDEQDAMEGGDRDDAPLDWTIELTDAAGNTGNLPLSHDSALYPLVNAVPRRAGFLESEDTTEVLFRRFEWPLEAFETGGDSFGSDGISRIVFRFDRGDRGAIIIDELAMRNGD
jgi:hypothetical protein